MIRNNKIGVSSGVLARKMQLESLLAAEPDFIEFYNYSTPETKIIREFCHRHHIAASLHTPVPYDEPAPLRRFCATGPRPEETSLAIRLTENTIRLAADMDALHVVVHFPSPYKDAPPSITADHIRTFFDPLAALAYKLRVKLLIENLSSHPRFHRPEDYLLILKQYPHLGICIDLGHAFLLDGDKGVAAFLTTLADHIQAVHLYGLEKRGEEFVKTVVAPATGKDTAAMDLGQAVHQIRKLKTIPSFILELPVCADGDMQAVAGSKAWLRSLLR